MRRAACAVVALMALSVDARADKDETKERAASAFATGRSELARGNFAEAAAAFEQAATLSPHPAPLLDAAEAWELAHEPVRAADACDRALAITPLEARYRDAANTILARVSPKIVTLTLHGSGETPATVDDAPVVPPKTIRLAPGAHALDLGPGAHPRLVQRAFQAGDSVTFDVVAAPPPRAEPSAPPPSEKRASSGPPALSLAAFGVAFVAAGATTYFAIATAGAQDDFNRTPTVATKDGFYRARTATNVSAGVLLVSAATGVVAWVVKF